MSVYFCHRYKKKPSRDLFQIRENVYRNISIDPSLWWWLFILWQSLWVVNVLWKQSGKYQWRPRNYRWMLWKWNWEDSIYCKFWPTIRAIGKCVLTLCRTSWRTPKNCPEFDIARKRPKGLKLTGDRPSCIRSGNNASKFRMEAKERAGTQKISLWEVKSEDNGHLFLQFKAYCSSWVRFTEHKDWHSILSWFVRLTRRLLHRIARIWLAYHGKSTVITIFFMKIRILLLYHYPYSPVRKTSFANEGHAVYSHSGCPKGVCQHS